MADSIVALEGVQYGVETTAGDIVAADTMLELEGGGSFAPAIERVPIEDRHGVLAITRDLDVLKGSVLNYSHVLDYEQMAIALACGLAADPVTGAGPSYDRIWTPSLTAPDALDSASFEVLYTDGATAHLQQEFGFGSCMGFSVEGEFGGAATFSADWFGRAQQASVYTASQAPLAREEIAGGAFGLYVDSSWANLGTTQKTSLIKSFKYTVDTGVRPGYAMDARADLDMGRIIRGILGVTLEVEYWFNGDAATEYAAWKAGTLKFMSLESAGAGTSTLGLQGAFRYAQAPSFSEDEGLRTMTATMEGRRDATSGNLLSVALTNSIATL